MTKKNQGKAIKSKVSISLKEYAETLADIKNQVQEAQIKATLSANKELIRLYWMIGKKIVEKQQLSGWGTSVIEKLAGDLQNIFPGIKGFSRANFFYMRAFYIAYEKVQTPSGQLYDSVIFNIPWWHNVILLTQLKDNNQRFWYAKKAIEHGWSGNMLDTWIKSNLYLREGKAITNFQKTLPAPHSDMAEQSLKDPYTFDFLTMQEKYLERDVEFFFLKLDAYPHFIKAFS